MVQKAITVAELQQRLREVIDEVKNTGAVYALTRGGRAQAALVRYDSYQRLQALHEKEVGFDLDRFLKRMRRQNANRTEGEVRKDIRLARSGVRRSCR